jgi:hypothetical protein
MVMEAAEQENTARPTCSMPNEKRLGERVWRTHKEEHTNYCAIRLIDQVSNNSVGVETNKGGGKGSGGPCGYLWLISRAGVPS